jgi:hypothetical protein
MLQLINKLFEKLKKIFDSYILSFSINGTDYIDGFEFSSSLQTYYREYSQF